MSSAPYRVAEWDGRGTVLDKPGPLRQDSQDPFIVSADGYWETNYLQLLRKIRDSLQLVPAALGLAIFQRNIEMPTEQNSIKTSGNDVPGLIDMVNNEYKDH